MTKRRERFSFARQTGSNRRECPFAGPVRVDVVRIFMRHQEFELSVKEQIPKALGVNRTGTKTQDLVYELGSAEPFHEIPKRPHHGRARIPTSRVNSDFVHRGNSRDNGPRPS